MLYTNCAARVKAEHYVCLDLFAFQCVSYSLSAFGTSLQIECRDRWGLSCVSLPQEIIDAYHLVSLPTNAAVQVGDQAMQRAHALDLTLVDFWELADSPNVRRSRLIFVVYCQGIPMCTVF